MIQNQKRFMLVQLKVFNVLGPARWMTPFCGAERHLLQHGGLHAKTWIGISEKSGEPQNHSLVETVEVHRALLSGWLPGSRLRSNGSVEHVQGMFWLAQKWSKTAAQIHANPVSAEVQCRSRCQASGEPPDGDYVPSRLVIWHLDRRILVTSDSSDSRLPTENDFLGLQNALWSTYYCKGWGCWLNMEYHEAGLDAVWRPCFGEHRPCGDWCQGPKTPELKHTELPVVPWFWPEVQWGSSDLGFQDSLIQVEGSGVKVRLASSKKNPGYSP